MFPLSEVIWLSLIIASGMYWWSAQGVKQIALRAARMHCKEMDVQMLDDCVVLHRFWFKRDASGTMRVWRSYLFEFASTGDARYHGRVILLGRRVLAVQLEPHRI